MNNPLTGFIPIPWPQQSPAQQVVERDQVPARVQCAMVFLCDLTNKSRPQIGIGSMGNEVVDAPEILPVERKTQADALNLLSDYFKGAFIPTEWELAKAPDQHPEYVMPCPHCGDKDQLKPRCGFCGGSGKVAMSRYQEP